MNDSQKRNLMLNYNKQIRKAAFVFMNNNTITTTKKGVGSPGKYCLQHTSMIPLSAYKKL